MLDHIVKLGGHLRGQMAQVIEAFGQQTKVVERHDAIVVHVQDAVQGAHLATPEGGIALEIRNKIYIF